MTYSVDLRASVVEFVRGGGSKSDATRIFGVSRQSVYDWLRAKDLTPNQRGISRMRKIDPAALAADVEASPDSLLKERAARFGVHISSIAYALRQQEIRRKKNLPIFPRIVA